MKKCILFVMAPMLISSLAMAQVHTDGGTHARNNASKNEAVYSPFVDRHVPDRILWGDTHLHTSYSVDAGFFGNRLGPDMAYRFARGEEVTSSTGQRIKLVRPLDWLVVADHGEYLGLSDLLGKGDPVIKKDPTTARWYKMRQGTDEEGMQAFYEVVESITTATNLVESPAILRSGWDNIIKFSTQYNDPGVFTAFTGYEWSSAPNGNNLHRVLMFRDGADRTQQVLPFSAFDSSNPEDLWEYMAAYEEKTGGRVIAMAHNGNWGTGMMFSNEKFEGGPLDAAYAKTRMQFEPIYEVTQIKGDGEAHPILSPDDEFADFGTWDKGDIGGRNRITPEMLPGQYARPALLRGLEQESRIGVNPFKFGLIGSTDAHTSLATTREDNFFGKNPPAEPAAGRWDHVLMEGQLEGTDYYNWETLAGGLTGVWARENTRNAIFDAFERKEVYATSGSRIKVRVFAGWNFNASDVERQDFADLGYSGGVPMGGDLSNAPRGKAPRFIIRALRDPDNANLDRIQIIKGWLESNGKTKERIYDVAVTDGRKIGSDGRCKTPVGNTVNVADATYTNTIGEPLLTAYWEDPDFDPNQRAFYYIRVIEIPKPSWRAYDAKFYGLKMSKEVPMTVQDRAYTSPIWYTPGK